MAQEQKNTLEEQLNEARETIVALTQKVAQLQNALDDKETQFREFIRRYSKREGQAKAQNGANKSANGSATNISSSGVSIQSNGDAAQPASSAVSPSAQNRSLTDSATQTTNTDDEFDSEDQFDAGGNRYARNGSGLQRQVSFGFPTSPKMDSESGSSSFANEVPSSQKFDRNANLRTARTMKNGSINSEVSVSAVSSGTSSGQPSLKHSRTSSSSAAGPITPNRIISTEHVPVRAKETDYLSLATFASIDQTAAAASQQSDNETDDADAATITNSSLPASSLSPQLAMQNRQSALPAVVPVPIPVRIDAARRPDSLNWPHANLNGAAHKQPTSVQPSNQQITSFVVSAPTSAAQAQSPLLATFSMTNFSSNSVPTPASAANLNGNSSAAGNQRLTIAAHSGPPAANNNSPAAQPLTDKQDLAMRCLDLPLAEWKAGHVMAWLELHAGLQPYSLRCAENVKSGAILNSMTDSELEQLLGIEHPLHKRKLQLALAELRASTYSPHLKVNSITHYWTARTWLREIGLPQYAFTFEQALVDGRLLTTLTKKDLEKYLHVEKKSHQASLIRSIDLLRRFSFDIQALADRRARCEYVNADLVVWTNRRLSVWLKEIDLLEFSKVEMTGLNGAYIVYEGLSNDSLCSALHIPSSKSMVRKHLETKLRELSSAPTPTSVISIELQNGLQNGSSHHNGAVHTQLNTKVSPFVAPNAGATNGAAFGDGYANEYVGYVNAYPQEQLDYINLDTNTPKASNSHKSRNYVTLDGYQQREASSAASATRSDPRSQTATQAQRNTMQPTMTTARPMRNAEQRSKLDDSDLPDRDHDQEKNSSKFVRSASASRSTSRKMAGLRSSLGKAFSKKSNASQPEADKTS